MAKKFQIETFAKEVVKMKLKELNFAVQETREGFNAVAPNGDKYFVLVRGRRRTAGLTESQEDESVKISLKNVRHLLDNDSLNTHLGVVVIKAVSKQVEVIIAPFRDILEINRYFESGRSDICYVRMKGEYLFKYANMPSKLVYTSEPLSSWSDLYLKLGGRIVGDILNGNVLPNKVTLHSQSSVQPTPSPNTQEATDLAFPPDRVQAHVYRILRDTELALRVKYLYRFECQICGHTIELSNGKRYAESHHIQPLGQPHNGPDVIGNILCVCPNHHAELDYGVSEILLSTLSRSEEHPIDQKYIDYHNLKIHNSTKM